MRLGWPRCAPAERRLRMLVTVGSKRQVRMAFRLYGRPLTTTELVKHCYWSANFEGIKSWHRTNVSRVADLLAIRIGRATSQGRPIMWSPRPELMQDQLGARQQKRNGDYRRGARSRETTKLLKLIKSLL
jgi:hypothetical protein